MTENKKLITVAEAAKILNRSKSAIYQALNSHPPRLEYHDLRSRLLLREGLETRFARSTRPRVDAPQAKPPEPGLEPLSFNEKWEIIAETANQTLDCSRWGKPPWSAQQWAVLAGTLEMGFEALEQI